MQQLYPLRTCIINNNFAETNALKSNILQHPGFFSLCQITHSVSDSYQILHAEKFDITICDHNTISIDSIFSIGQQRLGILVFLDKEASVRATNHPQAQGKSFYIQRPYNISLANLIGSLRAEFAERKLVEQITNQYLQKKITLRFKKKFVELRQELIIYVQGSGHLFNVAYLDSRGPYEIPTRHSLKHYIEKLDTSIFFPTDRDSLINLLFLREIDTSSKEKYVTLRSDSGKWSSKIPISERALTRLRRRKPDFFC